MSETGLIQILEGALLAAGKPLTVAQMAELFEEHERPENAAIREAMKEIAERCDDRGFELVEVASGFRFQVRQPLSPWVARLWHERPAKYSRALLETLALIAYRQPITRGEIEEIRGVAVSSNIIKTLHEREWIRVVGHRDVPGRPAMYATTRQFLDYFNLKNLDQLPALAEIRDLDTLNAELGFTEPLPDGGAKPESEGDGETPGLTVVGGTEHVPETTAADAAEGDLGAAARPPENIEGAADPSAEGAVQADMSTELNEGEGEIVPERVEDLAQAVDGLNHAVEDDSADEALTPEPEAEAAEAVKPENQA